MLVDGVWMNNGLWNRIWDRNIFFVNIKVYFFIFIKVLWIYFISKRRKYRYLEGFSDLLAIFFLSWIWSREFVIEYFMEFSFILYVFND